VDGPGSMSVGAISFFSFLSGVGSCAAFQGALKTGEPVFCSKVLQADSDSYAKLADTSRDSDGFSTCSFWTKRILLHGHRWLCIPWKHVRLSPAALTGDISSSTSVCTFSYCGRPPERNGICRSANYRAHAT
jgi:hypothetical protein